MGQRKATDRGKEIRRFRLALWPNEWELFDRRANWGYFAVGVSAQIENILALHVHRATFASKESPRVYHDAEVPEVEDGDTLQ